MSALVLTGGVAIAQEKPPVGSAACSTIVDHSPAVENARGGLDLSQGADNAAAARLTAAATEFESAKQALAGVRPGEPGYAGTRERYEEDETALARATTAKHTADLSLARARAGLAQARDEAQQQLCAPA